MAMSREKIISAYESQYLADARGLGLDTYLTVENTPWLFRVQDDVSSQPQHWPPHRNETSITLYIHSSPMKHSKSGKIPFDPLEDLHFHAAIDPARPRAKLVSLGASDSTT
jgi:hypothetical protein